MHAVDVTVSDVDSDGPEGEAVLLPGAVDRDWRMQDVNHWGVVPAGGRVAGGGVGREGARRHGAGERGGAVLLH